MKDHTEDRARWQWREDFDAWYSQGESLAREEEGPNGPPDPDLYAAYDDEAARLALTAFAIMFADR